MDEGYPEKVVYRGEGPYPRACDFCGQSIQGGERYVVRDDAAVMHEVCHFLLEQEAAEEE